MARKHSAFDLAIQRLSKAQIRKLAAIYHKSVKAGDTKDRQIAVLRAKLSPEQKQDALRKYLLAGRISITLFRFLDQNIRLNPEPDFVEAASVPSIVLVGRRGELFPGLCHIIWTVLAGENTYVDPRLDLQVDDEAIVIDSFYERKFGLLQVRAGSVVARKVGGRWATLAGQDPDRDIDRVGIDNVDDAHRFARLLGAGVVKCKGRRLESKGFDVVTGKKLANINDLRGTDDYENFLKETDTTDVDLEFDYDGRPVVLGIGFGTRSIVFRTIVAEATIRFVYDKLKQFHKLRTQ